MWDKVIKGVGITILGGLAAVLGKGYHDGLRKNNEELKVLKEKLVALEAKYQELLPLLGEKNRQVRMLADEISKLRKRISKKEEAA